LEHVRAVAGVVCCDACLGGTACCQNVRVNDESLRAPGWVAVNLQVPRTSTDREFSHLAIPFYRLAIGIEAHVFDEPSSCTLVVSPAKVPPCRSSERILRHTRMPEVGRDSHNSAHGRAVRSAVCDALPRHFVRRLADSVAAHGVAPRLVDERASYVRYDAMKLSMVIVVISFENVRDGVVRGVRASRIRLRDEVEDVYS